MVSLHLTLPVRPLVEEPATPAAPTTDKKEKKEPASSKKEKKEPASAKKEKKEVKEEKKEPTTPTTTPKKRVSKKKGAEDLGHVMSPEGRRSRRLQKSDDDEQ